MHGSSQIRLAWQFPDLWYVMGNVVFFTNSNADSDVSAEPYGKGERLLSGNYSDFLCQLKINLVQIVFLKQ